MLTLLLDLDGTLLDIQMETFIPAYFQALSGFLEPYIPAQIMLPALLKGTRAMMGNRDPSRTLRQTFDATFFPLIGRTREELQPVIDRFYEEVFPTLNHLARPRPEARQLVEWALENGHRIAITTNPIFPRRAIEHRLTWAGLPPEHYPFSLITSYETFHFAKPSLEYYAEVLGCLGWPEGAIIMIGDDWELDIQPARALSFTPYWVLSSATSPADHDQTVAHGALNEALSWLQAFSPTPDGMPHLDPPALLALLRATPAVIAHRLETHPLHQWRLRPRSGEWAALEILAHLRDVDSEVNHPRLDLLLSAENPFLPSQETDHWAEERNYIEQDLPKVFSEFLRLRLGLLEKLEALTPEQWSRPARHSIFGPITLQGLVNLIAEHDRQHLSQLTEVLSHCP